MEHVSWLTEFVNHHFGSFVLPLYSTLHIQPADPRMPIPEHVVMSIAVLLVATILALVLKSRLSVERPGPGQQVAELLLRNPMNFGICDILEENAGHDWRRYVPMVGAVSMFILIANLFGVFPFFAAPTATVTVPLACAIVTFIFFNWQGIRHHGPLGYLKTFTGGLDWWLVPLIFPVELLSTSARLLSLTVRLWANIFASDMIYGLFLGLFLGPAVWGWTKSPLLGVVLGIFPAVLPIAFIALHIFVSIVQTYVFTILPAVYIGLATADEH
jgi:F-type H+-transporting ATPase subunit a